MSSNSLNLFFFLSMILSYVCWRMLWRSLRIKMQTNKILFVCISLYSFILFLFLHVKSIVLVYSKYLFCIISYKWYIGKRSVSILSLRQALHWQLLGKIDELIVTLCILSFKHHFSSLLLPSFFFLNELQYLYLSIILKYISLIV